MLALNFEKIFDQMISIVVLIEKEASWTLSDEAAAIGADDQSPVQS